MPDIDEEALPVILALHGSLGDAESNDTFANYFTGRGYAVLTTTWHITYFPKAENEVFCALAWTFANVESYNFDTERVVVGFSAGGYLSALLGTVGEPDLFLEDCEYVWSDNYKLSAVVSVAGVFDWRAHLEFSGDEGIVSYFQGKPNEVPEKWDQGSPFTWIDGSEPPFLLIHGENDDGSASQQSVNFAAALEEAGVEVTLVLDPWIPHNNIQFSLKALHN